MTTTCRSSSRAIRRGSTFPQRRESDGYTIVMYAPQFRRWPDFEHIEAWSAIKVKSPDGKTDPLRDARDQRRHRRRHGREDRHDHEHRRSTTWCSSGTYRKPKMDAVKNMATRQKIVVPVELILAYLTDDVLDNPPPPGFSTKPPKIVVAETPTVLLFVNGEPVMTDIADSGLKLVVNASWPVFLDPVSKTYYLCQDRPVADRKNAHGAVEHRRRRCRPAWTNCRRIRVSTPLRRRCRRARRTNRSRRSLLQHEPTELIVTGGEPKLEVIPETDGLEYVTNTTSPLFRSGKQWYYLVSGSLVRD